MMQPATMRARARARARAQRMQRTQRTHARTQHMQRERVIADLFNGLSVTLVVITLSCSVFTTYSLMAIATETRTTIYRHARTHTAHVPTCTCVRTGHACASAHSHPPARPHARTYARPHARPPGRTHARTHA